MEDTFEGIKTTPCRSCKAPIVFLRAKSGKILPIDAETVEAEDTEYIHKKHRAHFATCPDAVKFRKK